MLLWGCSSPGRASPWHGEGSEFEPRQLHHYETLGLIKGSIN